jgi:O-acetylhomoserine (thiol)-lyase
MLRLASDDDVQRVDCEFLCYSYQEIIDRICKFKWNSLVCEELVRIAYAYYYFSIQFRENLDIACRLHPEDPDLKTLHLEECNTDNLSPWAGVAEPGEKLNHDEFMRRLLALQPVANEQELVAAGEAYLAKVRAVDDLARAKSIASYEDTGLTSVFSAILSAPNWEGASQQAFRHFLQSHISFDGEGGHGDLASNLVPDETIAPLWSAFEEIFATAVPRIAELRPARSGMRPMRMETIAIHGGFQNDPATRAVAVPIYQSASFEFESAEHGAALFNLEAEGYRYSRISNPTTDVLERRVAALEGGLEAMCVASGMAALHLAVLNLAEAGANIVSVPQLYGTTHTMFAHLLPSMGIEVRFATSDRAEDIAALIDAGTRAVFCESIGNPAGNICDIEALAHVAHAHGVPLVVDNTVATPILLRPIDYGADIVVHSLTKFMGGHGTSLGGAVVDSGRFPWAEHAARFPKFNLPDESYHGLVYTDHFGATAFIERCRAVYMRTTGAVLSPFNSFLLLQGIETVALRVERHVENGRRVAEFLRQDPRVTAVNYAGFPESPHHALAQKYLNGAAPSLMTFGTLGGYEGGMRFYNALKLIKRLVNLGDAKTLACHPASTTHRAMTPEEQRKAGVTPETIRMSVGIEHADDLIEDLDQALDCAAAAVT